MGIPKAVDKSKKNKRRGVKKDIHKYPYLVEIRNELILDLKKRGLSTQNISVIFSSGLSKGRVSQIIKNKFNK